MVAALIDRAQTALAASLEDVLHETRGLPLAGTLEAIAKVVIRQQYDRPLLEAALDHEEKRLPLRGRLDEAEARILASVTALLERHAEELCPGLPAAAARDCLVLTKALVEADVGAGRKAPADLDRRVVRALMGYLTWRGREAPA